MKHCKNDTYKLTLDNSKYFIIKIYSTYENLEKLNERIKLLLLIKKHYQNITEIIPKKNGQYITTIKFPEGNRYITLQEYARGIEQKYINNIDSYRYGIHIANLHNNIDIALTNYTHLNQNNIKVDFINSIQTIMKFLENKNRIKDLQYINELSKLILKRVDNSEFEFDYCHNDLHGGNAHLLGEDLMFFDFDFSNFYPRAYELAVFKWSCEIGKRYKQWSHFIDAYISIRPLKKSDIETINFFILIRNILIMSSDIDKTKFYGEKYLSNDYINKRILFLKNIEIKYNIFN